MSWLNPLVEFQFADDQDPFRLHPRRQIPLPVPFAFRQDRVEAGQDVHADVSGLAGTVERFLMQVAVDVEHRDAKPVRHLQMAGPEFAFDDKPDARAKAGQKQPCRPKEIERDIAVGDARIVKKTPAPCQPGWGRVCQANCVAPVEQHPDQRADGACLAQGSCEDPDRAFRPDRSETETLVEMAAIDRLLARPCEEKQKREGQHQVREHLPDGEEYARAQPWRRKGFRGVAGVGHVSRSS